MRALARRVQNYTRRVQAAITAAQRHGLRHKPKNTVEVGMLLFSAITKMNNTLCGMYDIMRSNVSSPLPRSNTLVAAPANLMFRLAFRLWKPRQHQAMVGVVMVV